jgi:hypothetical protein
MFAAFLLSNAFRPPAHQFCRPPIVPAPEISRAARMVCKRLRHWDDGRLGNLFGHFCLAALT